jgi:hypothetical protein
MKCCRFFSFILGGALCIAAMGWLGHVAKSAFDPGYGERPLAAFGGDSDGILPFGENGGWAGRERGLYWIEGSERRGVLGLLTNSSVLIALGTICLTLFGLMLASVLYDVVRSRGDRRSLSEEEKDTLKAIWQDAQKMEDRIVNLEVILMNQAQKAEYDRGF